MASCYLDKGNGLTCRILAKCFIQMIFVSTMYMKTRNINTCNCINGLIFLKLNFK